jgi:uncharacterized protein (DUF983 family)
MSGVNPMVSGLACRCPICGRGKLFDGFLKVVPACAACGQDLSNADPGDGPVVFVILVVGGLVAFVALYAILTTAWPIWLHMLIWLPLTLGLSLGAMRVFKSLMITAQYRFKASEARRD